MEFNFLHSSKKLTWGGICSGEQLVVLSVCVCTRVCVCVCVYVCTCVHVCVVWESNGSVITPDVRLSQIS